jgi:hypothetical protein
VAIRTVGAAVDGAAADIDELLGKWQSGGRGRPRGGRLRRPER